LNRRCAAAFTVDHEIKSKIRIKIKKEGTPDPGPLPSVEREKMLALPSRGESVIGFRRDQDVKEPVWRISPAWSFRSLLYI